MSFRTSPATRLALTAVAGALLTPAAAHADSIVYTDARGFPVTEFNVALPWTKAVVLNPGVQTESVIATSIYGQLNCSIVNAQGQLVKASTSSSALATCTR